ncbi:MAG: LemA family protein [Nitrospirae bacterium]|nr:LemA family protein [Nitrospirota bacterium]MBI3595401.1 LemA family protein [Nitrospirota bacterium]
MKKLVIVLGAILLIGLIFLSSIFSTYNRLVQMNESIKGSWAQVDNQLQRRFDLIPNLVNTVKGYAAHEKEILEAVANARARIGSAQTTEQKINANQEMTSALSRLLVVVENYPNLKADLTFQRLMDELAGTENRISVERKRYNDNVQTFNQEIKMFPSSIVASFFNFKEAPYFKIQEEAKSVPKVDFSKP